MTRKTPLQSDNAPQLYDELLVMLIQGGDRKAADMLVKRWHPRLLKAARRYTNDPGLAEQLTQDCWLGIWRGIGRLRDASKFTPWAFTILRNRGAKSIRAQITDRERSAELDEQANVPPQEDGFALEQAFSALSPDHRLAAHLHFVEGFTLQEIAVVQSIPIGTAKSRLFHARQKLKAALTTNTESDFEGETA